MTTPTTTANQSRQRAEAEAIAAVAALLAIGAAASALTPLVARLLLPLGLSAASVTGAVTRAMSQPLPEIQGRPGTALRLTTEAERTFRAAYIVAAARRLTTAARTRDPRAANQEREWFQRHLEASEKRIQAARAVDREARRRGTTLGWYSKGDLRTTTECRWLHGRNFQVGIRPPLGYPGTVHVQCRCVAGPPHRTRRTVYDPTPWGGLG